MFSPHSTDAVCGNPSPGFPQVRAVHLQASPALAARGVSLRWLDEDDHAWLRDLYASTREHEFAQLDWDGGMRRAFLDQQFDLQHRHYLTHFAEADFLAVCGAGRPLGRLYLCRTAPMHLLVDICLFSAARNEGIGRQLIDAAQCGAAAQGCGIRLHVATANAGARRLYERLGFIAAGVEAAHLRMEWQPG